MPWGMPAFSSIDNVVLESRDRSTPKTIIHKTEGIVPGKQEHWRALKTDKFLRVNDTNGTVYALGDASTVSQDHVLDRAAELFEEGDLNNDGSLSCNEIVLLMSKVA